MRVFSIDVLDYWRVGGFKTLGWSMLKVWLRLGVWLIDSVDFAPTNRKRKHTDTKGAWESMRSTPQKDGSIFRMSEFECFNFVFPGRVGFCALMCRTKLPMMAVVVVNNSTPGFGLEDVWLDSPSKMGNLSPCKKILAPKNFTLDIQIPPEIEMFFFKLYILGSKYLLSSCLDV